MSHQQKCILSYQLSVCRFVRPRCMELDKSAVEGTVKMWMPHQGENQSRELYLDGFFSPPLPSPLFFPWDSSHFLQNSSLSLQDSTSAVEPALKYFKNTPFWFGLVP